MADRKSPVLDVWGGGPGREARCLHVAIDLLQTCAASTLSRRRSSRSARSTISAASWPRRSRPAKASCISLVPTSESRHPASGSLPGCRDDGQRRPRRRPATGALRAARRVLATDTADLRIMGEAGTGTEAVQVAKETSAPMSWSWTSACPTWTASRPPAVTRRLIEEFARPPQPAQHWWRTVASLGVASTTRKPEPAVADQASPRCHSYWHDLPVPATSAAIKF